MRNVTITLEEEVARWARVWAARQNKSVSRLVGELLKERMLQEEGYERAMEEDLAAAPWPLKVGDRCPRREEIHER
ncbi:MAG TPA: DUF6364 family protein [Candidatus Nitrosotenuis sp.]|jgi:plasmid stability protein|nr:DUF6364 family protein [Candidatus Nitrosotenuis sp.]